MAFQSKGKAAFPWEQGFRERQLHNASGVYFAAFHKISHYLNSDVFMSYMDKWSYVFIWTSPLLELVLFFSPLSLPRQNKSLFYCSFGNFMQMAVFTHQSSV